MINNLKVAIVHDYLHQYGGAEGVVNAIWELFPQSDIYSATYDSKVMKKAGAFQGAKIYYPKWKNNIPGRLKQFMHKVLIANLPLYFENLNLSEYDLVISSTAHFAKGVKTNEDQLHISYIHTPPRFLYGYQGEIRKRSNSFWKLILWPLDNYLRKMDLKFSKRPNYLLCNSHEVQQRIKRIYNRNAKIVNPFPEVEVSDAEFRKAKESRGDYFLVVSRLAEYKNIDLAIKVCGKNGWNLKVAGTGTAEERLRVLSDQYKNVEMLGFVTKDEKQYLYRDCKSVICAVRDEDFGMAPLEPMMYGKPVVCLKQGGYLETVNEKVGVWFTELTEDSLEIGIRKLENRIFDPEEIRAHAKLFSKERFQKEFLEFVENKL